MGIKERKEREKEAFRKLVIATAHEIVLRAGLEGLTMRTLAHAIEYSQSKIYEIVKNKEELCQILCQEVGEKLNEILSAIPQGKCSEKYLIELFMKTIEFLQMYPHAEPLFTLVTYGRGSSERPAAYRKNEELFDKALLALNSPHVKSEEALMDAHDVLRCIFIGVTKLMATETSFEGRKRAIKMSENAIKLLIRGWKSA